MTFDEWAKNRWDDSPELDYKLDDLKAAYEFGRQEAKEEAAELMEIQSPHLFMDPDGMAEKIRGIK